MPNVVQVLKAEITRLARKEAKAAVAPIRRPTVRLRKELLALKRRLASLEKASHAMQALLAKAGTAKPAGAALEPEQKAWISGRGIKSLRKRLGLSQAEFAKLAGVANNTVYIWERRPGMLKLRNAGIKAALFSFRGIGAREARKRLVELQPKKAVGKRAQAGRREKK